MKRNIIITALVIGCIMLFSFPVKADDKNRKEEKGKIPATNDKKKKEDKKKKKTGKKPKGPSPRIFDYKPPKRGTPENRIGAGTRTWAKNISVPYFTALVPEHIGLTTRKSPVLYWYLSESSSQQFKFSLNDEQSKEALVHTSITVKKNEKIQVLKLSDFGVSLVPEREYTWTVEMVVNIDEPISNISSNGYILRVVPSKTLSEKLDKAEKLDIPGIYAEEGIWYDALAELLELIAANPGDKNLRSQLAILAKQVKLEKVVESLE
ncbi:MAG: DUF928 domain-containing protein [Desulfobacterales bacterium]|nr:DUF928 domain-containing protein [Desulfobacterales bacterium]